MQFFLNQYKKCILQILGLFIGYILTSQFIFLILAVILTITLLILPKYALYISGKSTVLIHFTGNIIKKVILLLMFVSLIIPISLIRRLFKKNKIENSTSFYIDRNISFSKINMELLW